MQMISTPKTAQLPQVSHLGNTLEWVQWFAIWITTEMLGHEEDCVPAEQPNNKTLIWMWFSNKVKCTHSSFSQPRSYPNFSQDLSNVECFRGVSITRSTPSSSPNLRSHIRNTKLRDVHHPTLSRYKNATVPPMSRTLPQPPTL